MSVRPLLPCHNSIVTDPTSWVSVARLIRPQGRHGEVIAEILTDFPERFAQMQAGFLRRAPNRSPSPVVIERTWLHQGRVVLKFARIDSISDAETLRGAELVIPAAERLALEPDAAYIEDLIGCELIDASREGQPVVGVIQDILQQSKAADLLVVIGADGAEHWIPFAREYLVQMDLAGRRLILRLPAGLLEVNAPLDEEERRIQQREPDSA